MATAATAATRAPKRDADLRLRMMRLKIRHLNCALEVARCGSLRRTAELLCVTESAVSKTLRELESELGVALFERSRLGMKLTDKGREFMSYASNALDTLQAGVTNARHGASQGVAVMRVGAMSIVAATLLPGIVRCFHLRHPNGMVEVAPGLGTTLLSRLRDGLVDLVIGRLPPPAEMAGLAFEELYLDRYAFFVRRDHPLSRVSRFRPERMAAYPIITPPRQTEVWREIHDFLNGIGVPAGPRVEALDVPFSRALTLTSDAIWVASERVTVAEVRSGLLMRLPLRSPEPPARIGITTRRSEIRAPQLRAAIDVVHEATARFLEAEPDPGDG